MNMRGFFFLKKKAKKSGRGPSTKKTLAKARVFKGDAGTGFS